MTDDNTELRNIIKGLLSISNYSDFLSLKDKFIKIPGIYELINQSIPTLNMFGFPTHKEPLKNDNGEDSYKIVIELRMGTFLWFYPDGRVA